VIAAAPCWAATYSGNGHLALRILGVIFVLFVLAGLPMLSLWTVRNEDLLTLPRKPLYFSAAVSQWVLAVLTFVIDLITSAGFEEFRAVAPGAFAKWLAFLLIVSLAGLGAVLVLEARGWLPEESKWVYALLPRTNKEKLWAVLLVAPTAGFCEEFLYRGYLLAQLSRYLHSAAWAWVISSVAFGMAHSYQKLNGAARAALLGALLAWPVVRLGSIYPSMAAHFLIDAVTLAWLGPLSLRQRPDTASVR
jgi:membrane protease YdiL (CAAX protease family)